MILTAIGAGVAALGAGANAIMGGALARKERRYLREAERSNQRWYDRMYNEGGTERADFQYGLSRMRDLQREQLARARGVSSVMGASSETSSTMQRAQNAALGNAMSQAVAQQEARRDKVDSAYRSRKDQYLNQRMKASAGQRANLANAVTNLSNIAANTIAAYGDKGGVGGVSSSVSADTPTVSTPSGNTEIAPDTPTAPQTDNGLTYAWTNDYYSPAMQYYLSRQNKYPYFNLT